MSTEATPSRFCRSCRYPLAGLRTNRCPECGRTFDPDDAATYLSSGSRRSWPLWVVAAVTAYPLVSLALLYATWGAAWLALGHRPRFSLDDPGEINEAVALIGDLCGLAACCAFFLAPFALIFLAVAVIAELHRRRFVRAAAIVLLPILSWSWWVYMFATYNSSITRWYLD